jgi:transposase-like protein
MRQHWATKGSNDPKLIARVREAAADPTRNISSVGISPTLVQTICRKHGIRWIPCGQRGVARLLTEQKVREALQGRSTIEAAALLRVNVGTLYKRFGHLLTKRTSPGTLDRHRIEILDLVYRKRVARTEVARQFGVAEVTVTKSIRRWLEQGAIPDDIDGQAPIPRYRGQRPSRKAQRRARLRKIRAEAPQAS